MKKIISVENLKDCLKDLFCFGGGWVVTFLIDWLGIIKVGEGLSFLLMVFTISFGLSFLWEYLEELIVYLMKTREEKEQIHLQRWRDEMSRLSLLNAGPYWSRILLESNVVEEICKLIDKLCKDKYVKIEDKKVFYDRLCEIWTKYGLLKGIYTIPPEIQKKWKKAQADDKLRQLKKDF